MRSEAVVCSTLNPGITLDKQVCSIDASDPTSVVLSLFCIEFYLEKGNLKSFTLSNPLILQMRCPESLSNLSKITQYIKAIIEY